MKIALSILVVVLSAACTSKKKPVNSLLDSPVYPIPAVGRPVDPLSRPIIEAVSGQVISKGDMPIRVSRAPLRLSVLKNAKWETVIEFNSETDGSFRITRPLLPGRYELRIISNKYEGAIPLDLQNHPIKNLVFEVSEKP